MDFRRFLNLAIAVFVTVGLAVVPLGVPAVAALPHAGDIMNTSMSEDMPCCPDEQKSKDCHDCPLVAMCILKTAQTGPAATAALPLRHANRTTHAIRDDVVADGLGERPPDHPPRNLT
jgi:hypothetical protein